MQKQDFKTYVYLFALAVILAIFNWVIVVRR